MLPVMLIVTIASVLPSNLHPDLKLGLLLVFAAVLLEAGGSASWAVTASDQLGLSAPHYGWLSVASGLGGLSLLAAVIWVDSRPPHRIMAAGALVLAIGLALFNLSENFGLAVLTLADFVSGAAGSAVGSLIFYAVAVKGYTRYKGVLIGALNLVFSVRWAAAGTIGSWASGLPIEWFAVILVLAGGTLLFVLLPRLLKEPRGPGRTLREIVVVPGAKVLIVWVAAVYLLGAMTMNAGTIYLQEMIIPAKFAGNTGPGFGYQVTALVGGIGALLWGISADFFPVRRLLIALAVLSLPAAGCMWLPGGQAVGVLLLSLVLGGLISLPWVLMAESLPVNHFAKLALGITWVGLLGGALGLVYLGLASDEWETNAFFWIFVADMAVMVAVVACQPGMRRTGS